MLAKLVRTLPEGPQWEYELKLDGYRLQAIKHSNKVRLYSRRGNDFTKPFAPIAAAVSKIKAPSFILDGEAVAIDPQGNPSFQMLQNHGSLPRGWNLVSYAFDLLHLNGKDLPESQETIIPLRFFCKLGKGVPSFIQPVWPTGCFGADRR